MPNKPTFSYFLKPPLNNNNWDWVGASVTDSKDISTENVCQAYGLTQNASKPCCKNHYEIDAPGQFGPEKMDIERDAMVVDHLSTDGNDVGQANNVDTESKSTIRPKAPNDARSAATKCNTKCRENPNCLNNLGQELWEAEGK